MNDRQTYASFRGTKSRYYKMKQVIPQFGARSQFLFDVSLHVHSMPTPTTNVQQVIYPDDFTIWSTKTDINVASLNINDY